MRPYGHHGSDYATRICAMHQGMIDNETSFKSRAFSRGCYFIRFNKVLSRYGYKMAVRASRPSRLPRSLAPVRPRSSKRERLRAADITFNHA